MEAAAKQKQAHLRRMKALHKRASLLARAFSEAVQDAPTCLEQEELGAAMLARDAAYKLVSWANSATRDEIADRETARAEAEAEFVAKYGPRYGKVG
jgi:hypothetical protein